MLHFLFIFYQRKKNILNFEVKKFISLGTPKDYDEYINWQKFF